MFSLDFWLAILIVWFGSAILLFTSVKFFNKHELKDIIVGMGLIFIFLALFLNGIFYLFYLFTEMYWMIVEIFHIIGVILIVLGVLGNNEGKSLKIAPKKTSKIITKKDLNIANFCKIFISAVLILSLFFLLLYFFKENFDVSMFGGRIPHFLEESLGGLIAVFVSILAFGKYVKTRDKLCLVIGLAFLANGLIDIFHGFVAMGMIGIPFSSSSVFIPGTWTAGRVMMGVILCSSLFIKNWESPKEEILSNLIKFGSLVAIITLIITSTFALFSLPAIILPNVSIFTRPWEFLPAVLLTIAFVKFYYIFKENGGIRGLGLVIMMSILVGIFAQLFMAGSGPILTEVVSGVEKQVFDPLFIMSHLIKILSYLIALLGFLFIKKRSD